MTPQFICTGHDTIAGCGAVLTDEERRYYHVCCEKCEQEWLARIEAWRAGAADAEFDARWPSLSQLRRLT
ncbi:hypothetical protein [Bradyrhizobium sp. WYCCWR 12699]|uniref:hypothetical protein n=1 Tax=Bradyrhizobium sp. WYCCWR 12699 TaxID=3064203 RepID=UPI0028A57D46|nr:hypothetical protein [Bradyrhizobium sp. WYCCWR 12699]MDT4740247.1 hypothetical protein [Bradyrhizobium sp. WYCCWR 12699]